MLHPKKKEKGIIVVLKLPQNSPSYPVWFLLLGILLNLLKENGLFKLIRGATRITGISSRCSLQLSNSHYSWLLYQHFSHCTWSVEVLREMNPFVFCSSSSSSSIIGFNGCSLSVAASWFCTFSRGGRRRRRGRKSVWFPCLLCCSLSLLCFSFVLLSVNNKTINRERERESKRYICTNSLQSLTMLVQEWHCQLLYNAEAQN